MYNCTIDARPRSVKTSALQEVSAEDARVIMAVLGEPQTIGATIDFVDGETPIEDRASDAAERGSAPSAACSDEGFVDASRITAVMIEVSTRMAGSL